MASQTSRDSDEEADIVCSDIPCLVILIFSLCGLLAALSCIALLSDPMRLRGPSDYYGRVCGVSTDLQDHPFIYWPLPDQLHAGQCLQRCPTYEDQLSGSTVPLPRAEPLVLHESSDGSRVVLSQAVWLLEVPVYPTVPAVGRFCVPAAETTLFSPGLTAGNGSFTSYSDSGRGRPAKTSMLPAVQAELGQFAPQLQRTVGSIWLMRMRLAACAFVVPLLTGAVFTFLASYCARLVTWLTILLCGLGSFSVGMLAVASDVYMRGTDDFIVPIFNSLQPTFATIVGWSLLIWSACILIGAAVLRHVVDWAAASVQVTAGQLRDARLAFPAALVASVVACGQAMVAMICIWLLEASVSLGDIRWPAQLASAAALTPEGGTTIASAPSELEAEVVPGGPVVRGLSRELSYNFHPVLAILAALMLLHAMCALLASMGRFLIAHLVAHWYYFPPFLLASSGSRMEEFRPGRPGCLGSPFCNACGSLFSGHVGSVAAATLLPLLLPSVTVRLLSTLLSGCCSSCAMLGAGPFVEVAVHGNHFYVGAAETTKVLRHAPPSAKFLGGLPIILEAALAFATSLTAAGLLFLSVTGQSHDQALGYTETSIGFAMLGGLIAHAPGAAFPAVYTAAFDTFIMCLARGEEGEMRSSMSGKHAPDRLHALFSEAAEALQAREFRSPQLSKNQHKAPHGYIAVGESSDSDSEFD